MSPPPPTVRITIESDGAIYWDDARVESPASLAPRFQAVASQQIPPLVRVIPDRRARYEIVAQVLAAAQRAHVERLAIAPVTDT
jgi:biopolymer transport protein ExbD